MSNISSIAVQEPLISKAAQGLLEGADLIVFTALHSFELPSIYLKVSLESRLQLYNLEHACAVGSIAKCVFGNNFKRPSLVLLMKKENITHVWLQQLLQSPQCPKHFV